MQDAAVADPARIKGDANRLSVAGCARGHRSVAGRFLVTAGIAGNGTGNSVDVLKYALDAPETAAGQDCDLRRRF
jgi:hypothetical protein